MSFEFQGYEVSWTNYVEGVVENNTQGEREEVLTYLAEKLIEKYGEGDPVAASLEKMPLKVPPELGAYINPQEKKILFGTDVEVQQAAENA